MSSTPPYDSQGQDAVRALEEANAPPSVESTQEQQRTAIPEAAPSPDEPEANGGPLGCCLGVTMGIVFSLVIGVTSRFYADPLAGALGGNLSIIVRILMAVVGLVAAIICGYLGWRIGQKVYKDYEPPVIKERRRR